MRLRWDKMISAAGSCDLLFNCKYSARQVEDEVREEHHHTMGGFRRFIGNRSNRLPMMGM